MANKYGPTRGELWFRMAVGLVGFTVLIAAVSRAACHQARPWSKLWALAASSLAALWSGRLGSCGAAALIEGGSGFGNQQNPSVRCQMKDIAPFDHHDA